MTESTEKKEATDYKLRAKRAWETRRANASKRQRGSTVAAPVAVVTASRGRGRPRKERVIRFGQFEVTSSVYTYEQVKELGAAAVTTDGSSYRLLRQNGVIVPASTFERA